MTAERPTGLTKDVGWQVGVSRTVPVDLDSAWAGLISPAGLDAWLGDGARPDHEVGSTYATDDGTTGEIRSWGHGDRLRATRQRLDENHETTIQVTVSPAARGTRIGLHQERMESRSERLAMREHWRAVVNRLQVVMLMGSSPS